jgi:hypothetical protein
MVTVAETATATETATMTVRIRTPMIDGRDGSGDRSWCLV